MKDKSEQLSKVLSRSPGQTLALALSTSSQLEYVTLSPDRMARVSRLTPLSDLSGLSARLHNFYLGKQFLHNIFLQNPAQILFFFLAKNISLAACSSKWLPAS